jgi:hypothetical protein
MTNGANSLPLSGDGWGLSGVGFFVEAGLLMGTRDLVIARGKAPKQSQSGSQEMASLHSP